QGFETRTVDVEAIYDQFGHGNKSPEAIRDFVKAAASWDASPRFLLLARRASSPWPRERASIPAAISARPSQTWCRRSSSLPGSITKERGVGACFSARRT